LITLKSLYLLVEGLLKQLLDLGLALRNLFKQLFALLVFSFELFPHYWRQITLQRHLLLLSEVALDILSYSQDRYG